MAPSESVLRLFQLLPFPLPFTDLHFLMPDPANQILAISSGVDRLSVEMSVANLLIVTESIRPTCAKDTAPCDDN
jgi:hypothetical protein